jgi:rod shape-determining protein MreC
MRNLLNFLLKYINLIVFLILEGIALYWLTNGNSYHNSTVVRAVQGVTRGLDERINNVRTYLNLREINSNLASENSKLKNRLEKFTQKGDPDFITVDDSLLRQQYQYTSARVINNSVNKQKNYFTLDKGSLQGIKVDMAVTNGKDAVGVIVGCSENFSVAISLLNLDFRLSARLRSNGYFGSLSWDGRNYRYAVLNEVPQHISVNEGDTIETTGFSAVFPEGIEIGRVSDLKKSGSDFYKITVELFTDFKKLQYVNVIGNLKRTERLELENQFQ